MVTFLEREITKRKIGKEYYLALYPKLKEVNFSLEEWFGYYENKKKEPEISKIKEDLRNYIVTEICKEHKNINMMQTISKIYSEIIPNYLEEDKELTVRINTDTRLEKYSAPLYLPPGKSPKDYKKGTGTLADFKVGDRVTAHASTDISGVTEFTASSVKAVEFNGSL